MANIIVAYPLIEELGKDRAWMLPADEQLSMEQMEKIAKELDKELLSYEGADTLDSDPSYELWGNDQDNWQDWFAGMLNKYGEAIAAGGYVFFRFSEQAIQAWAAEQLDALKERVRQMTLAEFCSQREVWKLIELIDGSDDEVMMLVDHACDTLAIAIRGLTRDTWYVAVNSIYYEW